ncbi:MAG: DUF86 domain-containing protein [Bacillota bacterium]
MKYDIEKITPIISELNSSTSLLRELSSISKDIFITDIHKVSSAKYNLIIAIEAIIDICNHIISKNGYRVPEDYTDTFNVMAENKLFTQDFAATLIKMARFRNRLVHVYWKIDDDILYDILQNDLKDFDVFLKVFSELTSK